MYIYFVKIMSSFVKRKIAYAFLSLCFIWQQMKNIFFFKIEDILLLVNVILTYISNGL